MSIFSQVLTEKAFELERCTKDELGTFENQFNYINSTVPSFLDAIGVVMFWASAGDFRGDHQIPNSDAINTFSRLGELMQMLSAFSEFSLTKEIQCRDRLKEIENNEAPKTAINGASNIQPRKNLGMKS